jgi:hypothetical protein
MRRQVLAAVAALVVCGAAAAAGPAFGPKPADSVPQVITRMKAALRAPGCNAQLKALFYSGYGAIPQSGCDYLRKQLGKFQDVQGKAYGSGAIVDGYIGDSTDNYAEAIFVLDKDRKYHLVFVEEGSFQPTTETLFMSQFDTSFRTGIHALRTGNCDEFMTVAHLTLGIGGGKKADVCARIPASPLHKLLAAEPRAVTKRLGGSSSYAFYGVKFKHAYYTVVMAQQAPSIYIPKSAQFAFIAGYSAG